jgi:hypothetical protein
MFPVCQRRPAGVPAPVLGPGEVNAMSRRSSGGLLVFCRCFRGPAPEEGLDVDARARGFALGREHMEWKTVMAYLAAVSACRPACSAACRAVPPVGRALDCEHLRLGVDLLAPQARQAPARRERAAVAISYARIRHLWEIIASEGDCGPIAHRFAVAAEFPLRYKPVLGLHAAAIWV